MKIKKINIKAYGFDELDELTQKKVLNDFRYINVDDFEWWELCGIEDAAKEYGLEVDLDKIYFNLDRADYVYFDNAKITDIRKFCKIAGIKYREVKDAWEKWDINIESKHYAGNSGKNYINSYELSEEVLEKLNDCLDEFCDKVLSILRKDYDYFTSDGAIIETIEANSFEFLENGKRYFCL